MSLQLICGRAHSGKSTYIMNVIKTYAQNNQKVVLVVPEQFAHIAEMRLLRHIGRILDDYIEITSFNRLAMRSREMVSDVCTDIISPTGKSLVMSQVVENTELAFYKNISDMPGFVDVSINGISEFKKHNISDEMLDIVANNTDNNLLSAKLRDFACLYRNYEVAMGQTFIDSDDVLDILYNILCTNNLYSDCVFLFDEFSTFIPQEARIIAKLIEQSKQVYMTLCMDRDLTEQLFLPSVSTYNKFVDLCRENHYQIEDTVWLEDTYYSNKLISFAEKHLFSYPTCKYEDSTDNLKLVKAKNPYSEVVNAASYIVELVRDHNLRYRDICIICSDINAYNHIFHNVFSSYGIPFFMDEKTKVLQHHIVLFVINIIDVYLNNYSYESIFNFIKSGFNDISAEQIATLENFILKTNINKNVWLDDRRWDTIISNYATDSSYDIEIINQIRCEYILPLAEFHEDIKGKKCADYSIQKLYEYLCAINLPDKIYAYVKNFDRQNDPVRKKQYESVWNIIVQVFDEIHSVIGNRKISPEQLRKYLYVAFAQQSIGVIPTSVDSVMIGDIARTRTHNVKALVVIGANEGLFPIPAKNTSVITDKEKNIMSEFGAVLSTTSDVQSFYNQFLIYRVFSMPDSMLYVSYSTADCSYSTLAPSFSVERLKKVFGVSEHDDIADDLTDAHGIVGGNVAFENLVSVIKSASMGNEYDASWDSVYSYYEKNHPDMLANACNYLRYTNPIRPVSADMVQQHMGDEMHTTISRLQRYASCKYSYFLSYMLYLKEKPQAGLQSVDIGTIVHDIIEKICLAMQNDGIDFADADSAYFEKKIDELLAEYISHLGCEYAHLSNRQLYSVRRLKNALCLCFDMIKKQIVDSKFVPMGYEITFDDDNVGCIEIQLDDGKKLKITGKIDRADVYTSDNGNYIRVIDYKTGKKTFNLTDVVNCLDIQLPVYLSALVEGESSNKYGGAFFFAVDDLIIKAKNNMSDEDIEKKLSSAMKLKGIIADNQEVIDAFDKVSTTNSTNKGTYEQFCALSKYLKAMIARMWTEITSGDISANPYKRGTKTPCSYCPYASVCRHGCFDANYVYNQINTLGDDDAWHIIMGGEHNVD